MKSLSTLLFALALAIGTSACGFPLSPADLAEQEHHVFPQRSNVQVFAATLIALRSLGYDIVLADAAHGKIKTAPKLMTQTAYATSDYTAVATQNAVAWDLDIGPVAGGAAMYAQPRGYSGGQAVEPDHMNGSYLKKLFSTLYNEIDRNL